MLLSSSSSISSREGSGIFETHGAVNAMQILDQYIVEIDCHNRKPRGSYPIYLVGRIIALNWEESKMMSGLLLLFIHFGVTRQNSSHFDF